MATSCRTAHIVSKLSHDSSTTIREAALDALDVLPNAFPRAQHVPTLDALLRKAIELSESEVSDLDVIHELGEGWVAEETLAVALFCALRYSDNFESAVVAAVNHSGDSDSTGSVTGNIVGAKVGLEGIPEKFVAPLELSDVIVELADDLFYDCPLSEYERSADGAWEHKYIASDYADWKKSVS